MLWSETPHIEDVQVTFMQIGKKKARIKLLEQERKEIAIPIKKEKSRSSWLVDEACQEIDNQIAHLESELAILEAQKDFLNYWKEIYKTQGYVNR